MTTTLISIGAVGVLTILSGYALWYRHHKRQADRVYSFRLSEYRRLDTYPHNPDVNPRPLTRRDTMSIGEDLD